MSGSDADAVAALQPSQLAALGTSALAALDSNHDGKITAADAQFGELKVWVSSSNGHDGQLVRWTMCGSRKTMARRRRPSAPRSRPAGPT